MRAGFILVFALLLAPSHTAQTPAPAAAPASEWKQFRGTPSLTGVSSGTLPAALKVVWTYDARDLVDSSAAIVDGVVYVGGGNGDLLALDLATGKLRWKYTTGNLIGESSPAVGGGVAYIGDLAGLLHAVNVHDGSKRWTFTTGSEIKSSPVIVGDVVLIGSYDAHLYGLDAKSGQLKWKFETNGMVHATPAIHDGMAFIAGCDSVLRAIRVADGKEVYQIEAGAYTGASPLITNNRAYFGTFNNEVLAFDLGRRRRLWRYAPKDRQFPFYSSAALGSGRIVLGGRDKFVHALDIATGNPIWTFATRARVDSSPVIAGGRV
ncbi:MAG TPA: PQQ-binding-like beta-propeller repeat protein, partial [Vicinamibacterales bacterium]|nr:PQQ-binding-like beta-propeller repeat protein [Vicinamibacterales bacterium]